MDELKNFIKKRPHLVWYTQNYDKLSEESIVEGVLNYRNWNDYLELENVLGVQKLSNAFDQLKNRKRINLRPQTINYFSNYFNTYAR